MAEELQTFMSDILGEVVDSVVNEPETSVSGPLAARGILKEILAKSERNAELRHTYAGKCAAHNQYGLFNMLNKIVNFEIGDAVYGELTFREHLVVGRLPEDPPEAPPVPVGGICVDVQCAEGRQPMCRQMEECEAKLMQFLDEEGCRDHTGGGEACPPISPAPSEISLDRQNAYGCSKFLVHVSSQFDVGGTNAGSAVTSWVDRNLHTLEELRREFIVKKKTMIEQALYTAMKKKWYYVKHTATIDNTDDRKLYSIAKAKDYLSEGANIVLLRYLAITGYYGRIELACAYINGDLCRNLYECFGPEMAVVNNKQMKVCKIKRTIVEQCGVKHVSISVLTLKGQMVKHEWRDCDYVLYINPKLNIDDKDMAQCSNVSLQSTWEDDMQMFSKYLDQKDISLLKNRSYMLDHPELKHIISDYVNTILLLRPAEIYSFTYKFFNSIGPVNLPRNDYFE